MRKIVPYSVAAIVIGTILYAGLSADLLNHRLTLRTYLDDAHGLRAEAPVSVAGVTVGKVKSVRVVSLSGKSTAEITFSISTPYDLRIPIDAAATTASEGLLGDTFLKIKIDGANGPPAQNGTVLKALPPERDFATGVLHSLVDAAGPNSEHSQTTASKPAGSAAQSTAKQ